MNSVLRQILRRQIEQERIERRDDELWRPESRGVEVARVEDREGEAGDEAAENRGRSFLQDDDKFPAMSISTITHVVQNKRTGGAI